MSITWRDVAVVEPEFVQWIVATYGPLPDGPVLEQDYEKFRATYEETEDERIPTPDCPHGDPFCGICEDQSPDIAPFEGQV